MRILKKNKIFFFLLFMLWNKNCFAQDFPFGLFPEKELNMKNYPNDTSAHAVVLQEFGKSRITIGNLNQIKTYYSYHVKIKIFDEKGFDNGTVKIILDNNLKNNFIENVIDLQGNTFYKDENGLVQQAVLDKNKIYTEKINAQYASNTFTMPSLKKGCVIEYMYTIESPNSTIGLRNWEFQSNIPKIYSEYEVHIPQFFTFNVSLRGALKLSKTRSEIEYKCYELYNLSSDCSLLAYGMENIPAFVKEDFMTSPKNFISAISFKLKEIKHFNQFDNVENNKISNSWDDVDKQLKSNYSFGEQIKRKGIFEDKLPSILAGKGVEIEKSKAIFEYFQKNIIWNGIKGIFSNKGINKALETKSGSIADINIGLIAAFKAAGLNAAAVLLSTRENGLINELYPGTSDFDYVIARVDIGDQFYLFDASDPMLPFGVIPIKCMNEKGRVFSLDKPSFWMDLNLPQKEITTRFIDLTLHENGKLIGSIINYYKGYEGYKQRLKIKRFNSPDEYVENLGEKWAKVKILKSEIINLDSLNLPLGEKYDVEISMFNKNDLDRMSFNPFFINRIETNPFKVNERLYPVDWGMASEDRCILKIHLPENYSLENQPEQFGTSLPNNSGKFLSTFENLNNTFTFSSIIQFTKSIYSTAEYPYLKEFYNKIIQAEKIELIFKKNK